MVLITCCPLHFVLRPHIKVSKWNLSFLAHPNFQIQKCLGQKPLSKTFFDDIWLFASVVQPQATVSKWILGFMHTHKFQIPIKLRPQSIVKTMVLITYCPLHLVLRHTHQGLEMESLFSDATKKFESKDAWARNHCKNKWF